MPKKKLIFDNEYSLKHIISPHMADKQNSKNKVTKKTPESPELNKNEKSVDENKTNIEQAKEVTPLTPESVREPSIEETKELDKKCSIDKDQDERKEPNKDSITNEISENNIITPVPASIPEQMPLAVASHSNDDSCNFCTLAGSKYILKLLTFHKSLKNSTNNFNLWICCMDHITYDLLLKLNLYNATIFKVEDLEDASLLSVKASRKMNEYCWTLKAPLIQYVFDTYKISNVIYCDSDLFFFSDPKAIYEEWGYNDIFLCPQRDIDWVEALYGKYQAGLIGFRNSENGRKCIDFWRNKCIEWCSATADAEAGRFGDQKYIDQFGNLFWGIKISHHLGINAAPWNCIYNPNNNYKIEVKDGNVYIDTDKLVAFHFATIDIFNSSEFDLWSFNYIPIQRTIKYNIYIPYLTAIRESIDEVKKVDGDILDSLLSTKPVEEAQTYYKYPSLEYRVDADNDTKYFCTIISKKYLIKGLTFYKSLKLHGNNFHLWICCMDSTSKSILDSMKLENVTLINLSDIENDELRECKSTRTENEYCWTLKAPLVEHVLYKYDIDFVIYCDADIFFFSDPSVIMNDWIGYYFYICTQRGNYELEKINGRFQAGFIGFKKLEESHRILKWWKQKCIEWCFDNPQPENQRWGDQKYLDQIPMQFIGIKIETNLGINAAPWNIVFNNHFNVHNINGKVYIANDQLIFYHFGSMLIYNENEYDLWKLNYIKFDDSVINNIYVPYLKTIRDTIRESMPYIENHLHELFNDKNGRPAVNYFNLGTFK